MAILDWATIQLTGLGPDEYNAAIKSRFKNWLEQTFKDWAYLQDRKMDTQLRFSEHLGVSRQVLEKWLNKGSVPELAQVVKIAAHYPEVYKVMDIDPPLSRDQLPPNFATLVDNAKAEAEAELSRLGLASGSKEGLKIATAIFEKYGFIFKQTTKG